METLVLDAAWQPQARVTWKYAIVQLLAEEVKFVVVEEYEDKNISTVNWSVKMPSVIRLLKPIKRRQAVKFSRSAILARDKNKCQYCGTRLDLKDMQYEHVIPRAQGGRTEWTNIVSACYRCNQKKGSRTPEQAGMKLLVKPVRPKSLPQRTDFDLPYKPGMPGAWKAYLRDAVYWESELEHDGE